MPKTIMHSLKSQLFNELISNSVSDGIYDIIFNKLRSGGKSLGTIRVVRTKPTRIFTAECADSHVLPLFQFTRFPDNFPNPQNHDYNNTQHPPKNHPHISSHPKIHGGGLRLPISAKENVSPVLESRLNP